MESGYTHCACRDCFDIAISSDTRKPELCHECKEAGCLPMSVRDLRGLSYDCQRADAYGVEEED